MNTEPCLPEHFTDRVLSLAERLLVANVCNPADAVGLAANMHRQAFQHCGVTLPDPSTSG